MIQQVKQFYFPKVKKKNAVRLPLPSLWTRVWRRKGKVSICNAIKSISWLVGIQIWKSMYRVVEGTCTGSWHHVARTRFEPCHSAYPFWNGYSLIKCGRENNPISILFEQNAQQLGSRGQSSYGLLQIFDRALDPEIAHTKVTVITLLKPEWTWVIQWIILLTSIFQTIIRLLTCSISIPKVIPNTIMTLLLAISQNTLNF